MTESETPVTSVASMPTMQELLEALKKDAASVNEDKLHEMITALQQNGMIDNLVIVYTTRTEPYKRAWFGTPSSVLGLVELIKGELLNTFTAPPPGNAENG
jgi:hypothetical protein